MQLSLPLQCPVQLGVQRKHPPPPIHTSNCSVHLGVQCNPHPSNVLHDLWYNTVTLHNSGCNANPPHTHTAMPCTAWGAMQHPPPPPPKHTHAAMPCTAQGATQPSHHHQCPARLGVRPTALGATRGSGCDPPPWATRPAAPTPPHQLSTWAAPRSPPTTSQPSRSSRALPPPQRPARPSAAMCSPAFPRLPCHVHSSFLACEACSLSDSVAGKDGASPHLVQCASLAPGLATVSIQRHTDFNRLIQFFLIYHCSRS